MAMAMAMTRKIFLIETRHFPDVGQTSEKQSSKGSRKILHMLLVLSLHSSTLPFLFKAIAILDCRSYALSLSPP